MLGDLNLPSINWNTNMITCSDSIKSAEFLLSFMADNICSQFVLEPTRADNILDLYACSSAQSIDHVHVTDTRLSNHRLVEVYLGFNPCQPITTASPQFKDLSFRSLDFFKADYTQLNDLFKSIDWKILWDISDPDEFPELFTLVILQVCCIGCPKKFPSSKKTILI